jgi:hypothetical protein
LFGALALSLCQSLPMAQAAALLRVQSKRLRRRIEHYVQVARAQEEMKGVKVIGIDETSIKRGHEYVTVVHDLSAKRLLFLTGGWMPPRLSARILPPALRAGAITPGKKSPHCRVADFRNAQTANVEQRNQPAQPEVVLHLPIGFACEGVDHGFHLRPDVLV